MLNEFNRLKKRLLENEFQNLNDPQREAVFNIRGCMLILAGAGSGKTTTVVNRIAFMLKYGDSYGDFDALPAGIDQNTIAYMKAFAEGKMPPDEYIAGIIRKNPVRPYHILAFTFTNKAATEMKERIAKAAGSPPEDMWIGTFHSICVKILRRNIDSVPGYGKNFVIYDTDDQKTLMKSCLSAMGVSEKEYPPREVLYHIGRAKDKMLSPAEFEAENAQDAKLRNIAKIYAYYQQKLMEYNAVDFDDIINLTVRLLTQNPQVGSYFSGKFHYIMVDEYQDTNRAQYLLISALAAGHNNLCVVGDDDQSIYGWRGADIQNIIDFEKQYTGCRVIKLEQNYRSTQVILDAANQIISNNLLRKGKSLWTSQEGGEKITFMTGEDDRGEAGFAIRKIAEMTGSENRKLSDFVFLYRTHAQSRIIEDALIREGIPYHIYGGLRFYERKEIKDVLAYLRLLANPADNISLKRVINFPKRGIGDTTVQRIEAQSHETGVSMLSIIRKELCPEVARAGAKLMQFARLIEELAAFSEGVPASDTIRQVIACTEMFTEYKKEGEIEGQTRMENIEELLSVAAELEERGEIADINDFLEYTSLITDIDVSDENSDNVTLMTMHAAKGLEFPVVFVIGLEEGLFPKVDQYATDDQKLEEERRLCYVAITRAKEKLFLTCARRRMMYGQTQYNHPSRFIDELPPDLIESIVTEPRVHIPVPDAPKVNKYDFAAAAKHIQPTRATDGKGHEYQVGNQVSHTKFGVGTIAGISSSSALTVLTIDFEGLGRKNIVSTAVSPI